MRVWVLGLVLLAVGVAEARRHRVAQVPHGRDFNCALCHVNPRGGGTRTIFGEDSRATLAGNNVDWPRLCALDSDRDGHGNGLELGDPECDWTPGGPVDSPATNPSDPDDPGPPDPPDAAPPEPDMAPPPVDMAPPPPDAEPVIDAEGQVIDAETDVMPPPEMPIDVLTEDGGSDGCATAADRAPGLPWLAALLLGLALRRR